VVLNDGDHDEVCGGFVLENVGILQSYLLEHKPCVEGFLPVGRSRVDGGKRIVEASFEEAFRGQTSTFDWKEEEPDQRMRWGQRWLGQQLEDEFVLDNNSEQHVVGALLDWRWVLKKNL
jgi:hypothetical protein